MASLGWFKARSCYRVRWRVYRPGGDSTPGSRYPKTREEANAVLGVVSQLETATRTGLARAEQIQEWIDLGFLTMQQAVAAFPGYKDTSARVSPETVLEPTDFGQVLDRYEEEALRKSKARNPHRGTHRNTMARARRVAAWLQDHFPQLWTLRVEDVLAYSLRHTYATELARHHDLKTVQEHLGHADIRTTQVYLRGLKPEERPTDALRY